MTITLEHIGRRVYLRGNTYPIKREIHGIGGHWDADAGAWWVGSGKAEDVAAIVAKVASAASALPVASGEMVPVSGNTYPVRDRLRDLGGRWDAASKTWLIPASRIDLANQAVSSATSAPRRVSRRLPDGTWAAKHGRCWECGHVGLINSDGECGRC